jgi:hypothetical protein
LLGRALGFACPFPLALVSELGRDIGQHREKFREDFGPPNGTCEGLEKVLSRLRRPAQIDERLRKTVLEPEAPSRQALPRISVSAI